MRHNSRLGRRARVVSDNERTPSFASSVRNQRSITGAKKSCARREGVVVAQVDNALGGSDAEGPALRDMLGERNRFVEKTLARHSLQHGPISSPDMNVLPAAGRPRSDSHTLFIWP